MNSASLCSLAGQYDNPIATLVSSPHGLFENSSSGLLRLWHWQSDALTTWPDLIHQVAQLKEGIATRNSRVKSITSL
jgi:hypothetical protein